MRNRGVSREGRAEWQMAATKACATMFFLIPKNVTSERSIVLMPTLIRWWEAVRAPAVRSGSRSIAWIGTPRMVEKEELTKWCGIY